MNWIGRGGARPRWVNQVCHLPVSSFTTCEELGDSQPSWCGSYLDCKGCNITSMEKKERNASYGDITQLFTPKKKILGVFYDFSPPTKKSYT